MHIAIVNLFIHHHVDINPQNTHKFKFIYIITVTYMVLFFLQKYDAFCFLMTVVIIRAHNAPIIF